MAYADYEFYTSSFYGSAVQESDFLRLSERASDWLDAATFDRLVDSRPSSERSQKKIKKAVCNLVEVLYQLEQAKKQASAAASGSSSVEVGTGTSTGIVTSVSSGSESISYATPQQAGASAKEWSAVYAAAGDPKLENKLMLDTVRPYLMGVTTDEGVPLLYAGV
nr:MAG TPA: Head Tail Connector Protein [Caudoviricetes sp.]